MNLCGIIVEYNPLHNGHLKHIKAARELSNADCLIAVMSGNFTQRGEVSIIDKFEKTKAALDNGVNIVIELPFPYTCQNASVFGEKSIEILKILKVNHVVFGSETNDLENLKMIADTSINIDYLKEIMKTGVSYPKAYSLLQGSLYSNDILAIAYLKALKGSDITPHSILRTNFYHDITLDRIASAKAIRQAIKAGNNDYTIATPLIIKEPHFTDELYPYLRTSLLLSDRQELQSYHLVNEGIEKALIKSALTYDNYDDFINSLVSKRYTKARIQRTVLQIMLHNQKTTMEKLERMNYVRVLGFDSIGQQVLHELKKQEVPIISHFKKIPQSYRDIEWKSDLLYASLLSENKRRSFLKQELCAPIIKKVS